MASKTPPPFLPKFRPTGRFVLFMATAQGGWGAQLAVCHDDDFDDLLAAIPDGEPVWHILDLHTSRICASWQGKNSPDANHPGIPFGGEVAPAPPLKLRWTRRFVRFEERDDDFGAWCASETGDELAPTSASQVLDTATSLVVVGERPSFIIPALQDITDYQQELARWKVERMADLPAGDADDATPAEKSWFQHGLPEGWESMPTDQLRALVEEAERKAGIKAE